MGANHTALDVADLFIRLSHEDEIPVTPMQVQKLTYFGHAWMLGLGHGPLFQDAVESWQYGPVIRAVYHALKRWGSGRIDGDVLREPAHFNETERRIIKSVWQKYGEIDGLDLSRLTHAEGTPWHETFSEGQHSQIIPNHVIRDYYADIISRFRAETAPQGT